MLQNKTLLYSLLVFLWTPSLYAGEVTAIALQQYCNEVKKAASGATYDPESAEFCRGYMTAFFDSMIITEQLSTKPQLCIPRSVPTSNNYSILDYWIKDNKSVAATATASVALFSAFKTAYPCKK